MTPLLHTELEHSTNQSQYLFNTPFESPSSTSPSLMGLAHGLEEMSCLPQPISATFGSDLQKPSISFRRPPLLARRSTDDLPFTDSPLSRHAPYRQKPYEVTSSNIQRLSSHSRYEAGDQPTAQLSLDNTLAKQRIACQGCRGEYQQLSLLPETLLILHRSLLSNRKKTQVSPLRVSPQKQSFSNLFSGALAVAPSVTTAQRRVGANANL
jgi:hypothetical protein